MISEGDDIIVKVYKCTDEENEGKHRFTTPLPPYCPITQPSLFAVCVVLWLIQSTLPMTPHCFHSSPSPAELPCFPPKGFLCLNLQPHLSWTSCSSDGFVVHSAAASKASMEFRSIGSMFIVCTPTATWAIFLLFRGFFGKYFNAFRIQSHSWVAVSMEWRWVRVPASGEEGAYRESKA